MTRTFTDCQKKYVQRIAKQSRKHKDQRCKPSLKLLLSYKEKKYYKQYKEKPSLLEAFQEYFQIQF